MSTDKPEPATTRITCVFPKALLARLDRLCKSQRIEADRSSAIRLLVEQGLDAAEVEDAER